MILIKFYLIFKLIKYYNKVNMICKNIITISIIILIGIYLNKNKNKKIENWEIYHRLPHNYIETGSTPINFYRRDMYRKPYRYPVTFTKNYPIVHESHYN